MASTKRIDAVTTASGNSDAWTPGADFTLQGSVPAGGKAVVELQVQFDASMPWASVESFRPSTEPLMFCKKLPSVRLAWSGNDGALSVWSAE
jgi:hypothetical protein